MEITEAVRTQILFPGLIVSFVLVFAVLVFVFGFKSVEDFPFDKLATANDNRKPAGKKRKAKDKKVQPSQTSSSVDTRHKSADGEKNAAQTTKSKNLEKTIAKEAPKASVKQEKKQSAVEVVSNNHSTALKETKSNRDVEKHVKTQPKEKENKEKPNKNVTTNKKTQSKGKENVNHQNKKNKDLSSNKLNENTNDDDGGEWEQAISRKDKKIKKPVLTEEEHADKLLKPDPAGPGKKKKALNQNEQNEPAKVATENEPRATLPVNEPQATPPVNEPQATPPVNELPKQEAEVVTTPAATVKKVKNQKKNAAKSLNEVTDKKTVDPIVEEEQSSKPKEKRTPKEHSESTAFIENEKQNTPDVKVSQEKPTKEKQAEGPIDDTTPVFDELGDTWKEAKTAKKQSKKKVRKAE